MEAVFWACVAAILYNLILFPSVVILLSYVFGRPPGKKRSHRPSLTVLITAHNEEKHIGQKLRNTLELDYPVDRMEILVALDGCTDRTAEIASDLADARVRVLDYREHRGKTATQDDAVTEAKGEIILFTDATAMLNREAAAELVANLADPDVACATGWVGHPSAADSVHTGLRARAGYELYLRHRLGLLYSMLGAAGSIMAMPRRWVRPVGRGLNHDYAAPILALMEGKRTVYESAARAYIVRPLSPADELTLRTRVAVQGLRCIFEMPDTINPLRYPVLALMVISLRLLKWLIPIFFILALVANLFLLESPLYRTTLALQLVLYSLATIGGAWRTRAKPPVVFSVPYYFFLLNVSALRALWLYARRETFTTWKPTSR